MTEAEQRGVDYVFKLQKSLNIKKLIVQPHCKNWLEGSHDGWEALAIQLKLSIWKQTRRVNLIRRRLQKNVVIARAIRPALPWHLSLLSLLKIWPLMRSLMRSLMR
ncbi:hypothetical protein [Candidatus Methylobacter favarea]|nr:hypothetical protein [Candidatus Methylobacter favarea]